MAIVSFDQYERTRHTDATRGALCLIAEGDLGQEFGERAVDWPALLAALGAHGLLSIAYRYFRHRQLPGELYPEFLARLTNHHRLTAVKMTVLYRHVATVIHELTRSGPDFLVLKGPAVAHRLYPDPLLRPFGDLDLMVRERDWRHAHDALRTLGFTAEEAWSGPTPKLTAACTHYEVKYRHPTTGVRVEVHFDDLLNAGFASRDLDGYWARAQECSIDGQRVLALSPEDQLLHLCAHAHYHGYTRLCWFTDLAFAIRDHGASLDWDRLLATVEIEEAEVPCYYTLLFLGQLLQVWPPAGVLQRLRPGRARRALHELYMPAAAVRSLQPLPRADFSFYFRPFFKRLLPDLLVMGRRREKLHYLSRLLMPPGPWLRSYYGLAEQGVVAHHYLLHPMKLLYHVLAEVFTGKFWSPPAEGGLAPSGTAATPVRSGGR
jgi:hypothetical protein